jgi:hypothetical protein
MYNLAQFTLKEMTECGASLRKLGADANSMEEVAGRIVRYLYENLVDGHSGGPSCALVRFFKTHPYDALDDALREFADGMLGAPPTSPTMKCLTLLATAGEREEWNLRDRSSGHKAIPLPSSQAVAQIPMISQLVKQLGLEISALVAEDADLLLDAEQRSYNVFYVADAVGSPHIPAQEDFVVPLGIRSVLGFGGVLPLGDLFSVILFSKTRIPRETTELFKPLALCTKTAVLPFVAGPVFT